MHTRGLEHSDSAWDFVGPTLPLLGKQYIEVKETQNE